MEYGKYDPKGRSNKLLTALKDKQLSFLEFQRACAKWLLEPECWNTFYPKSFPAQTAKILAHEALPLSQRRELSTKYFADNPDIFEHKSKKLHTFVANEQRVKDLIEFMDAIDNAPDYEKLKAKKKDFERVVAQQGAELRVKKYLYTKEAKKVAEEVVNQFEGGIV